MPAKAPACRSAEASALDLEACLALARLAKALGHPARVRIVETLLRRAGCMGGDLAEEIGLAASTTSEHLRILKEAGVLTGEIARPRVCYALAPHAVRPLLAFLTRVSESPARALDGDCRA